MRLLKSSTNEWQVLETALFDYKDQKVVFEFHHYDILEFRAGPTENAEHFSVINVDMSNIYIGCYQ